MNRCNAQVIARPDESIEQMLQRFRKAMERTGTLEEIEERYPHAVRLQRHAHTRHPRTLPPSLEE